MGSIDPSHATNHKTSDDEDNMSNHEDNDDAGRVLSGSRAPDRSESTVNYEERSSRETQLRELIEVMRPAVQADGGDLDLVSFDVETGYVEVELRGACSSCAISATTLQGGVERILKGRLEWVSEVRGGVDETADPATSVALGRGAYVPKA